MLLLAVEVEGECIGRVGELSRQNVCSAFDHCIMSCPQ